MYDSFQGYNSLDITRITVFNNVFDSFLRCQMVHFKRLYNSMLNKCHFSQEPCEIESYFFSACRDSLLLVGYARYISK